MQYRWKKFIHLLQLTRVALIFPAISNIWLIAFFSNEEYASGWRDTSFPFDMPMELVLLLTAMVAIGLHVYGTALNDVLDVRHDRVFSPQRPLAAGTIAAPIAFVIALLGLFAALLAVVFLGRAAILVCLAVATLILFYDTTGKHLPAWSILTLGLTRAMYMLIINPKIGFAWPVLLMMTHVISCSAIAHSMAGKRPRLDPPHVYFVCAGWTFATLVIVTWMSLRDALLLPGHGVVWLGPIIAASVFGVIVYRRVNDPDKRKRIGRAAGEQFMQLSLIWLIVYDVSWLASAGMLWQAALHAILLAAALGFYWLLRLVDESVNTDNYRVPAEPIRS